MLQFNSYAAQVDFEYDLVAEAKYRTAKVAAFKAELAASEAAAAAKAAAKFNAVSAARRAAR